MTKNTDAVRPRIDDILTMEKDVELPGTSNPIQTPVLPTWRLVCICIR
jgi:hypothetical protein